MNINLKEKAKNLYDIGYKLKEISEMLSINYSTLKYWKTKNFSSNTTKNETELTEQEENFCIYYSESNHVYSSAIKSGYSESYAMNTIYQLMKKAKIKKRIKELKKIRMKANDITQEDIISELRKIAFNRDINQCYNKETGELNSNVTNVRKFKLKKDEESQEINIELEDRTKALELLFKYYGADPVHELKKLELLKANTLENNETPRRVKIVPRKK